MKKEIWQIPRSDRRDRCGKCMELFKKDARKFRDEKYKGSRFPKVCVKCVRRVLKEYNKVI